MTHRKSCRCAECRHERFNPGPPSLTKRQRRDRAHEEALHEDRTRKQAQDASATEGEASPEVAT